MATTVQPFLKIEALVDDEKHLIGQARVYLSVPKQPDAVLEFPTLREALGMVAVHTAEMYLAMSLKHEAQQKTLKAAEDIVKGAKKR